MAGADALATPGALGVAAARVGTGEQGRAVHSPDSGA
jgi:hypothetical protein